MSVDEALAVRRYGTPVAEPELRRFEVGAWSFAWQAGAVRWLHVGDIEIVRGVAAVLRDPQWGTYAPIVDDERIDLSRRHANLRQVFHLAGERGEGPLLCGEIDVEAAERQLRVALTLTAVADFETARSGLSVLLPLAGVAGSQVRVLHTNNRQETILLPSSISPSQPLFDIRQLRFSPAPGVDTRLDFEGDVFEMEDQRNWSDASFKVYNRPLAWPAPYVLEAGETLMQRVTVSLAEQEKTDRDGAES
ncbi:hypothetical protein [Salinicola halimionae]|uniref:hypothetical protein n=1 Tax=Salinicola halimionae TaxID=1949081 RepID=UPI000DA2279C|nr:hypothetical protein [Salinicola halimionae]